MIPSRPHNQDEWMINDSSTMALGYCVHCVHVPSWVEHAIIQNSSQLSQNWQDWILRFSYFWLWRCFPHLPDNTENKSESTYHSRVHTGTQKCPATFSNPSSSHADKMATILATNKARIPDMSALVESIEHLSKDLKIQADWKNPIRILNISPMPTSKPLWTQKSCSVTTPFSFFLLKISFTMVSPCFASVFANKLQPHTLFLDENISQKLQQANPLIQPSFSLSFSHSRQYNGACLTLRKGVELRVPLDLSNLLQISSSWQCKIQSWTLDRKSEIPHNDVQCFNYPIMDVIHQTVPNKKS